MKVTLCDSCGLPGGLGKFQGKKTLKKDSRSQRGRYYQQSHLDAICYIDVREGNLTEDGLPTLDLCSECLASLLESVAQTIREERKPEVK